MVRMVAIVLFALAACHHALAKPQASIEIILESEEAYLGDTVVVEVRWSGLLDPIDFAPLAAAADIVRETAGTRLAVVAGKVIDISSRRIELQPKRAGQLVFGPLRSGDIVSNTVSIQIVEMRPIPWRPGPDDIELRQSVSTTAPVLQQQVILDIVLTTRLPIVGEVATLPDLSEFRTVTIFAERRFSEGGLSKLAWRYLLFPQRSGKVSVRGAHVTGAIMKSRLQRSKFDLTADVINLDVTPSKFAGNAWWIAAYSLSLSDHWSGELKTLSVGDEIERTITVTAHGVLPEQIPDIIMPQTNGLLVAPLGASRSARNDALGSMATATFRFRVRALSPIPVFLDTVRLRWWNTTTDMAEEAIIPARRVDIGLPERGTLVQRAIGDMTWPDRARAALAGQEVFLWIAATISAVSIILAISSTKLMRRLDALHVRRSLSKAARTGDSDTLYRALRAAARASPADLSLREAVALLETEKFGPNPRTADLAWLVKRATAARPRRRSSTLESRLPKI